jgi:hypothetical protein
VSKGYSISFPAIPADWGEVSESFATVIECWGCWECCGVPRCPAMLINCGTHRSEDDILHSLDPLVRREGGQLHRFIDRDCMLGRRHQGLRVQGEEERGWMNGAIAEA